MLEPLGPLGQYYVVAGLLIIPVWRIVRNSGLDVRLALLLFAPFLGWLIVLGILAFRRWPINRLPDPGGEEQS